MSQISPMGQKGIWLLSRWTTEIFRFIEVVICELKKVRWSYVIVKEISSHCKSLFERKKKIKENKMKALYNDRGVARQNLGHLTSWFSSKLVERPSLICVSNTVEMHKTWKERLRFTLNYRFRSLLITKKMLSIHNNIPEESHLSV